MTIGHTLVGKGKEGVVVLHGWFGDYAVFEPTFNALDLDAFTYAFMDYRGYGKSKAMTGDYSMKEIAADALGLVNELGWDQFHLIGHSMGGKVAMTCALQFANSGPGQHKDAETMNHRGHKNGDTLSALAATIA